MPSDDDSVHEQAKPTRGSGDSPQAIRRPESKEMAWVNQATDFLDNRFEIPGLQIRFGFDFLLGLVPGVGDMISMGLSGLLIATMARHGASPRLVFWMLLNVLVDAIVGSVPLFGNLFDLFFKANSRNLKLMRDYYEADKHRGSVWPLLLAVFLTFVFTLLVVLIGVIWAVRSLLSWWAG